MPKATRFEDLTIFQLSRDLCKEIYAITNGGEFRKDPRFVQQIHASAGSVMDNIAEPTNERAQSRMYSSFAERGGGRR